MNKKLNLGVSIGFASSLLWLSSCGTMGRVTEPKAKVDTSFEQEMGPYSGPKASVAVSKFSWKVDVGSGSRSKKKISFFGQAIEYEESTEHAQDADGLRDMLTTTLIQSKRYKVFERGDLSAVTAEQELGASGAVEEKTAAKRGAIKGADILIVAAVTAWDPGTSETKGGVGALLPGMGVLGGFGMKKSYLAIDIRMIDSTTSEVLAATNVSGEAKEFKLGGLGGGLFGGIPLAGGLSSYAKTPFEKAIRTCLKEAVKYIVANTPGEMYKHK